MLCSPRQPRSRPRFPPTAERPPWQRSGARRHPRSPLPRLSPRSPPAGAAAPRHRTRLAALIGAGGAALLRARALFGATGLDDVGTLTALAHSASTMWAGSCYPLDGSATLSAAPMSASFVTNAISPASALGSRAPFGVKGVVSGCGRRRRRTRRLAGHGVRPRCDRKRPHAARRRAPHRFGGDRRRARRDRAARQRGVRR